MISLKLIVTIMVKQSKFEVEIGQQGIYWGERDDLCMLSLF
jgi:hypothetical protein